MCVNNLYSCQIDSISDDNSAGSLRVNLRLTYEHDATYLKDVCSCIEMTDGLFSWDIKPEKLEYWGLSYLFAAWKSKTEITIEISEAGISGLCLTEAPSHNENDICPHE